MVRVTDRARNDLNVLKGRETEIKPNIALAFRMMKLNGGTISNVANPRSAI